MVFFYPLFEKKVSPLYIYNNLILHAKYQTNFIMRKNHTICIFAFLCLVTQILQAQVPAFPGADGYGRYTRGGRGGSVYYVTTLADGTSYGTLRYGVTKLSNVTILFKVSGTIHLNSTLKISQSKITIAGQSAPGDGICLADYPVFVDGDNVIVRYLRFRMGDLKLTEDEADGADAFGGRYRRNVIIDHCSISWSTDECASFYANYNFTMQWCIISESLRRSLHSKGDHGYGAIWGGFGASYLHNLIIHHDSRTPRFGTGNIEPLNEQFTDMRNNVIYNWSGLGCYGAEGMPINIMNNYYKPGPATTSKTKDCFITINDASPGDGTTSVWGKYYIKGNINTRYTSVNYNNWTGVTVVASSRIGGNPTKASLTSDVELGETPELHQHSTMDCYPLVLKYAGCSYKRDSIDMRLTTECNEGTTTYQGTSSGKGGIIDSVNDLKPSDAGANWSPWPTLQQLPAPTDTDNDGMPDEWEINNNLNPNDASDGNKYSKNGYTMLEEYLNSLVSNITDEQYKGATIVGVAGEPYIDKPLSTDVTLKYSMKTGTTSEKAVVSDTSKVCSGSYKVSNNLSIVGTQYSVGTTLTRFQPIVEYQSASPNSYVDFILTLPEDAIFRPTSIRFSSARYGTGGGYIDISWINNNGKETLLEDGFHPIASNESTSPVHEINFGGLVIPASEGTCTLRLYLYKLATSRQIGLANIEIGGHINTKTGISNVVYKQHTDNIIYNLKGQRVLPDTRGLIIQNGKLVFKR